MNIDNPYKSEWLTGSIPIKSRRRRWYAQRGGSSASETLYALNKPVGNEYAYVADNGALDIAATGLTFAMWVKGTSAVAPPAIFWLGGKHILAGTEGRYGFTADQTTGFLSSYTVTSGAGTVGSFWVDNVKIGLDIGAGGMARISAVAIQDEVWHFLLLKINAGTTVNLANQFEFYLGTGNDAAGTGVTLISKCAIAKAILYKSVLSDAECTDLFNGIIKAGYAAYWKFGAYPLVDETGNFNLTGVNLSGANILTIPSLP
jgi:hypothetical protein